LGASHVTAGSFGVSATGRIVLQRFVFEAQDADPAHEARWNDHTANALGSIASREKLAGSCVVTVPGHLALTKFIKTPALDPAKRTQSLAFEASQHIPYPLSEVIWDHVVIADDGFDLEVMFAAAKMDALESLCAAADSAGFAPERATPSSLALRAACLLASATLLPRQTSTTRPEDAQTRTGTSPPPSEAAASLPPPPPRARATPPWRGGPRRTCARAAPRGSR
jgi:type IV pilus assembly protein PilM